MMKRLFLPFLMSLAVCNLLTAQTNTNEKILKLNAPIFKLAQQTSYARAMAVAKEKNWDVVIKLSNGNTARLSGIDEFGFPIYTKSTNNTIGAATTRANQLWPGGASGLNLSGSSAAMRNRLGIWEFDGAPLSTHVEFGGRILQKDSPSGSSGNSHATHVAGTMVAAGINPIAKGMAFGIPNLVSYDYTSDLSEMTTEAAAGLLLSNHSYGLLAGWDFNTTNNRWQFYGRPGENEDYRYGFYSRDASLIDSILYNAPNYLMVAVAGNDRNNNGPAVGQPYFRLDASGNFISGGNRPAGISSNDSYDIITGYGIAKNCITVGAVNGIPAGYVKPGDVVMSAFSGWGPTDDGRIKPDIVADGVNVTSTSNLSNSSYATLSGTSMAGPNATGSMLLLQEYYTKLKPGNFMRAATLKGLVIHTTDEAGLTPGPDYQYGWGLLNVERAASVLTGAIPSNNATTSSDLLYENVLNNGQVFTKTVVATGKVPLKATIAWTDPVAAVNTNSATNLNDRTKKLVNDLDIKITRGSQTFLPWALNVLNPGGEATKSDNVTDNVERIDVDSTVPGQTYTITVSHKGNLARGPQAYSLMVSGVGGIAYCASASNPGGGAKIDSVKFSNINFGNTAGCKTYTDNTHLMGDIQTLQTIPFTVRVSTCDITTQSRMVKIFIDYNNDGDFLDANELAASSPVLTSATTNFTGNIVVPNGLTIGTVTLMRVIVQETLNATDINSCNNFAKGETEDFRLRVVPPSNDLSITNILSPEAGACGNNAQYISVTISNNGSVSQNNIPLTATVLNGSTSVASLTATYPGTIPALSTANYTFQTPFNSIAGTTYTITAAANVAADQNSANNSLTASVPIASKPANPAGQGVVCGTNVILSALNQTTANYFWYTSNTSTTPIAAGANVQTSTITTDRTYYIGTDARTTVGAASKLTYAGGSYFAGNAVMKISHTVPITIETARFYTGNSGQIKLTLADNYTPGTGGSFSYRPISSTTIDLFPSNTNGATTNDPSDSGFVYNLNLKINGSGDKIIIGELLNGATMFRNNGITGTTYPQGSSSIMAFTGNSASLSGGSENQFYYFFYDTRVSTGCASDRVAVVAAANTGVTLSQVGDSLVSSLRTGVYQWVFNDTATIAGANGSSIKPSRSGNYKVIVTDALGCARTSSNINFTVTALNTVSPAEIKLSVSPNPNNGIFQLSFETSTRSDLSIEILNAAGTRVFTNTQAGFIGRYSKLINLENKSSEFYILKIQHDKKTYLQKLLIQR